MRMNQRIKMHTLEEILEIKEIKEKKFGVSFESYEEFLERNKVPDYNGKKCFVLGCTKPGLYEGGDSRFYCGMCEDHADMKNKYIREMESILGISGIPSKNELNKL